MTLLIAGVLALDDLKTPHQSGTGIVGGAGVFSSLAASHFTKPVLLGPIGHDFPDATLETLARKGINIDSVQRVDAPTFHWSGEYTGDMAQAITHATRFEILDHYDWTLPPEYREVKSLLLCNNAPAIQLKVLEQVRADCVASDTMNLWIECARPELDQVISRTDLLFINDAEARMYTGKAMLPAAARRLMEQGPRFVVIKMGAEGALFCGKDFQHRIPAFRVDRLVDPTGAGDSFAGAAMGYLSRTNDFSPKNIHTALRYGTAVASTVVECFGTEQVMDFSHQIIEERFNTLEAL